MEERRPVYASMGTREACLGLLILAFVSPQFFYELNIFILTLQVRKVRLNEFNQFVQDYTIM